MTAGPGDYAAADAAGRGYLRASHADREQVVDVLKAAYVQGRRAGSPRRPVRVTARLPKQRQGVM